MRLPVVTIVRQRTTMDCGIAALAMLLDRPYRTVLRAARRLEPRATEDGLTLTQLLLIAAALGVRLRPVVRYSLARRCGLLSIGNETRWHFVVLRRGLIIDPDGGRLVDARDYFRATKTTPHTLLTQ